MVLQAIKYKRGSLQILDQLQLPHKEVYQELDTAESAWRAIKEMRVRGAPAIALVAALALAVELHSIGVNDESSSAEEMCETIKKKLRYLVTSRPTAVNLADAAKKLGDVVSSAASSTGSKSSDVRDLYIKAAEQMLVDDVHDNERIGLYGSQWITNHSEAARSKRFSVLTHCNTGYVSTFGTAHCP